MDLCCTRPGCQKLNPFPDLEDPYVLKSVAQKYCTACGMPLILAGRYIPLRLLGQGGFGAAFLARDRHTPGMRKCVVKQFQPSGNLTSAQLAIAQQLFEREAEALEDLGNAHPLIPDLFAFFELAVPSAQAGKNIPFFYLVQEFIDGSTLEELLQQEGTFTATAVIELLEEILPVLTFVHENGTIHRDIKPSNIMRHRNGHYYLLDFGAVRQATKGGGRSTGIYSEGFAPPEQMSGGEVYPSTDLYALAVTCAMLLTGKQPADLYDSYSTTWHWQRTVPQVSEPLSSVLDRMLELSPKARFHSAQAVLEALQQPDLTGSGSLSAVQAAAPAAACTPPVMTPPTALGNQPMALGNQPLTNLQPATAAPIQPAVQPGLSPTGRRRGHRRPFALLELLANAGFWGFESCLLAIALFSLPIATWLSAGLWLLLSAVLIWLQSRRWIEREDLPLLALLTLALVLFIPALHQILVASSSPLLIAVLLAVLTGLGAIAIMALFQLFDRLFQNFL